ncbi:hypothetical protein E7T09_10450 [Deinococcus sp. KSM4-11]|uniref:Ig-like domain-containing protein n=1 Tax=Deinococcus sp. KSM4-11 TaxID=2568654 RepID=UPI0010A4B44B|nr:Ig-like domain-containing protein [Deinococcus sp. KSM4-11]THF86520.1 hypothetical protein E7T09_10450 [Deinococcus sp. KSM4-11]
MAATTDQDTGSTMVKASTGCPPKLNDSWQDLSRSSNALRVTVGTINQIEVCIHSPPSLRKVRYPMLQSNTLRRSALAVLAATLSVGMMACNKTTTPATVTSVAVAPTTASVAVGATTTLKATVTGTNSPAQTVSWKSSSDAIATVSSAGIVTGKTAGTATITACSTLASYTTKCGTATVTVTSGTGGGTLTTAHINFAKAAGTVTVGGVVYTNDTGAAYNAATGIGWVEEASLSGTLKPLDMSTDARDRTATNPTSTTDARLYTQINMQCGTATDGKNCAAVNGVASNLVSGAFEYKVANGKYTVTVSVGDAATADDGTTKSNLNSLHSIRLEGTTVIDKFVPTVAKPFTSASVPVTVADGMLTVDAIGGKNTKINYIDIVPAP